MGTKNFGESKVTTKKTVAKKKATKKKRKYTRRTSATHDADFVTIRVPAELAFQIGMSIGQAL